MGTAILLSKSLRYSEKASYRDSRGRYVITKGLLNTEKVTIVSIYAPNVGQIDFLEEAFQKVSTFGEGTVIIAGDFNYVADLQVDRKYRHGLNKLLGGQFYTSLHALFEKFCFTDCWRSLHPGADYTFYSVKHKVYTRIIIF